MSSLLFVITYVCFLKGGLVSACDDASIHIWNLRQAQPALIQSLKFNRERLVQSFYVYLIVFHCALGQSNSHMCIIYAFSFPSPPKWNILIVLCTYFLNLNNKHSFTMISLQHCIKETLLHTIN